MMRHRHLVAAAAIASCGALAWAQTTETRRDVSPGSAWVIDDATCEIDIVDTDHSGVIVSIHDDHHDLQVYDTGFKNIANGKTIKAKFSAGEPVAAAQIYDARGVREGQSYAYVGTIRGDLLDRIAASNILRMYRDGQLIADFKMTGFREAFAALESCSANMGASDKMTDADASNYVDAAADAAAEAASDGAPK